MEPDLREAKRAMRARMKGTLAALAPVDLAAEDRLMNNVLRREFPPGPGMCVLATLALPGEVDLAPWLEGVLKGGGSVVLPRVEKDRVLSLWRVRSLGEVVAGPMGLREPDTLLAEPAGDLELNLALVPGLAFDARGGRLGRGGGFFDRLLTRLAGRVPLVAVCRSCQVVEEVPMEPHDVRVDRILAGSRDLPGGR